MPDAQKHRGMKIFLKRARLWSLATLLTIGSLATAGGCGSEETDSVVVDGRKVTLSVEPAVATKAVGETQAFVAFATAEDGTRAGASNEVTWSSTEPAVASIDPATGIATAVAPGTTTIRASRENIVATATLTVTRDGPGTGNDAGPEGGSPGGALLFVSNYGGEGVSPSIRIFEAGATSDTAPVRKIEGALTTLGSPNQMTVQGSELFVADGSRAVLVFDVEANGNVAPIRTIKGSSTTFTSFNPVGILVRGTDLFVTDQTRGLLVFPVAGSGDIAPTRRGPALTFAQQLSSSTTANEILVATYGPSGLNGFAETAQGSLGRSTRERSRSVHMRASLPAPAAV
jgi:hypothetical protein